MLNERVLNPSLWDELAACYARNGDVHVPMVVRGNELRVSLNWQCIHSLSRRMGIKPVVNVANIRTSDNDLLSRNDLSILFQASDTQTSNLATLLPMIPGMPVRITQNVAVELSIANGTEGTLLGVEFTGTTRFEVSNICGVECLVANELPSVAYVRAPLCGKTIPCRFGSVPSQYPEETIPIVPYRTNSFRPTLSRGNSRICTDSSLRMTQIPFVPAFASTTYKVQGTTAPAVVAFPFLHGCPGKPSSAALYVVLSRVRTLKSLFLTESLTEESLRHFAPSEELVTEYNRLQALHDFTIARVKTIERCIGEL